MRVWLCRLPHSYRTDSPSSGLFRVKVYGEHGMVARSGTGIFPGEVMKRFPLLQLEEEGRLNDLPLRESFIERIFAYHRLVRLIVPLALLKHHLRRNPVPDWVWQQVSVNPYPKELMLRNHA